MGEPMKIFTSFNTKSSGITEPLKVFSWQSSETSCFDEPMKLVASAYTSGYAAGGAVFQAGAPPCTWPNSFDASIDNDSTVSTSCGATSSEKSSPRSSIDALADVTCEEVDDNRCTEACLAALSLAERANLILPIVSELAEAMGLTQSRSSITHLRRLISEHPSTEKSKGRPRVVQVTNAKREELKQDLKCRQMHDLIALMRPEDAPPSVQISMETLEVEMQQEWASKQKKQGAKGRRGKESKSKRGGGVC